MPLTGHDPEQLVEYWLLQSAFQSTCPLRGTTPVPSGKVHGLYIISIHMPLTGHDTGASWATIASWISIHMPLTGHDNTHHQHVKEDKIFQSTCPLRGTTHKDPWERHSRKISIHMPLTGHDDKHCFVLIDVKDFNPHAPYGARPVPPLLLITPRKFQSTCPLRGTTPWRIYQYSPAGFQSTCPLRGTTVSVDVLVPPPAISIHMPLTGHDPSCPVVVVHGLCISIHMPLTGHDYLGIPADGKYGFHFNPHAPYGARRR